PQVSLDPEQLDFGDIDLIGQPSEALQVTVTNTGSGDLDIGTLTIQGSQAGDFDFGGDVCSGQIVAPDANCTFEVIFTPQAAGIRRAWVSIPSNAPGSPHRVDLLGTQDVIFFDGFESDQ
ncbi:MAG: choice-of-anchor D domain-containing protein, partial [Wenzhouxiangellaceae bacterium]